MALNILPPDAAEITEGLFRDIQFQQDQDETIFLDKKPTAEEEALKSKLKQAKEEESEESQPEFELYDSEQEESGQEDTVQLQELEAANKISNNQLENNDTHITTATSTDDDSAGNVNHSNQKSHIHHTNNHHANSNTDGVKEGEKQREKQHDKAANAKEREHSSKDGSFESQMAAMKIAALKKDEIVIGDDDDTKDGGSDGAGTQSKAGRSKADVGSRTMEQWLQRDNLIVHPVWIGNLPRGTTVNQLRRYVEKQVGKVLVSIHISVKQQNNERTYAFLNLPTAEKQLLAVTLLDGQIFTTEKLIVRPKRPSKFPQSFFGSSPISEHFKHFRDCVVPAILANPTINLNVTSVRKILEQNHINIDHLPNRVWCVQCTLVPQCHRTYCSFYHCHQEKELGRIISILAAQVVGGDGSGMDTDDAFNIEHKKNLAAANNPNTIRSRHTLLIQGLPRSITSKKIEETFEVFGEINNVIVNPDHTCYVRMNRSQDARKIVHLFKYNHAGVIVDFAPYGASKLMANNNNNDGGNNDRSNNTNNNNKMNRANRPLFARTQTAPQPNYSNTGNNMNNHGKLGLYNTQSENINGMNQLPVTNPNYNMNGMNMNGMNGGMNMNMMNGMNGGMMSKSQYMNRQNIMSPTAAASYGAYNGNNPMNQYVPNNPNANNNYYAQQQMMNNASNDTSSSGRNNRLKLNRHNSEPIKSNNPYNAQYAQQKMADYQQYYPQMNMTQEQYASWYRQYYQQYSQQQQSAQTQAYAAANYDAQQSQADQQYAAYSQPQQQYNPYSGYNQQFNPYAYSQQNALSPVAATPTTLGTDQNATAYPYTPMTPQHIQSYHPQPATPQNQQQQGQQNASQPVMTSPTNASNTSQQQSHQQYSSARKALGLRNAYSVGDITQHQPLPSNQSKPSPYDDTMTQQKYYSYQQQLQQNGGTHPQQHTRSPTNANMLSPTYNHQTYDEMIQTQRAKNAHHKNWMQQQQQQPQPQQQRLFSFGGDANGQIMGAPKRKLIAAPAKPPQREDAPDLSGIPEPELHFQISSHDEFPLSPTSEALIN